MGRVNPDHLERALASLGDAAADPVVWPHAMEEISKAVAATGAALLQSDVRTADIPRTSSVDELFSDYFRDGWHSRDVRAMRGVPLLLKGSKVVLDSDILTPQDMSRDAFYNELLAPCGFQYFAVVGFRAGDALWGLSVRPETS
jgi:hypothetical protein